MAHIDLDSVKSLADTMETLYPRKSIPHCMKMTRETWNKLTIPTVSACNMSTEQILALDFSRIRVLWDESMPLGVVRVYNSDDELIKEFRMEL